MLDRDSKLDMMRQVFLSKPLKIGGLHKFASSLGNVASVKTVRLQSKTLSHKTNKERKAPQSSFTFSNPHRIKFRVQINLPFRVLWKKS